MLTPEEIIRYDRHLRLPEIGSKGQEKLKLARVLVIGAGGLGAPVLSYLTAAGVGTIGIVDFDSVDLSNLQRQILFCTEDIGKNKADVAAERLQHLNPEVSLFPYPLKLDNQIAISLLAQYDLVIDCTDNFTARYLINDACSILGKPLIYGSIYRFEGQVSVFHYPGSEHPVSFSYRDLFPKPPASGSSLNCSEIGVLGVLPGIIGTLQACEAIKLITGTGELLSGKILMLNALNMSMQMIHLSQGMNANSPKNEIEFRTWNYDDFCDAPQKSKTIRTITAGELYRNMQENQSMRFLDVREYAELPKIEALEDLHIPLAEIPNQYKNIPKSEDLIVFCRSGNRSIQAIQLLQEKFAFTNLINLAGGTDAWLQLKNQSHDERKEKTPGTC